MRVQGLRFEGADGAPGSSVPSRLLMAAAAPGLAGLPFSLMFPSPLSSPGSRAGSSCQVSGRTLQWMPAAGRGGEGDGLKQVLHAVADAAARGLAYSSQAL